MASKQNDETKQLRIKFGSLKRYVSTICAANPSLLSWRQALGCRMATAAPTQRDGVAA